MSKLAAQNAAEIIERIVKEEWGRVLSALTNVCQDFDTAEEVLQDAVEAALKSWPVNGVPNSPQGWLLKTAQRRGIDRFRRGARFNDNQDQLATLVAATTAPEDDEARQPIPDERLKLIFTCCHPSLSVEARVALTLRTVSGITTPEIARAFVVSEDTMAQRLVRAKRKIKVANIPYIVPEPDALADRLQSVLSVIYLIFNEGYAAATGPEMIRQDLCKEAVRLCEILLKLMPNQTEVRGLLALMLLHNARQAARWHNGDLITLELQDRSLWDQAAMSRGRELLIGTLAMGEIGPYQLQAAISAVHSEAKDLASTDWNQICLLYQTLHDIQPSPIVALNRAVAVSFAQSPQAGLEAMDDIADLESLESYLPFHAARADMFFRAGNGAEARQAFERALDLGGNEGEQSYLRKRLEGLKI